MQNQFLKRKKNVILILLSALVLILLLVWLKFKPIKGEVEEFLPVSQEISIRFFDLKPALDLEESELSEFSELKIDGGWLKMKTRSGGLYILRIMPQCVYEGDDYFFVKTDDKPEGSAITNDFLAQTTRNGYNYNIYKRYEDITRLSDLDKIYAISPLKYEVSGKRIHKKSLLKNNDLTEREKFVVRNLPARAKIVDVIKLRSLEKNGAEDKSWIDYLVRFLPWLLIAILLLLLLFNWKRLSKYFKRTFMAHKENLEEFGYLASGKSGGDPSQFRTYLNGIYNGDLADAHNSVLTDPQVKNTKLKISELDQSIEDKKAKIEELNKGVNLPIFDPIRFVISMVIFIGLTIFSYFFYLSTINKALFLKFENLNCEEASRLSVLPSQAELTQAIQNSLFILVVPFTVFALGWILHLVLDNNKLKTGQRVLFLGALLLITFVLDFLLATYIHKNLNAIKVYCGYGTDEAWYVSTTFYIIIFMGFLVYIFWSLILNNILQQVEKINKKRVIQNRTEKLKFEIENLRKRKDRQLNLLETRTGNISGSIDNFHQGWNMFMNNFPERFEKNRKECEAIRNEFIEKISRHHE